MYKQCVYIPSEESLFGVLDDAPSPINNSAGLAGGGECTLDPLGFLEDIGADIDGRLLTKLKGRPSSESLSPVAPERKKKKITHSEYFCSVYNIVSLQNSQTMIFSSLFCYVYFYSGFLPCDEKHCP